MKRTSKRINEWLPQPEARRGGGKTDGEWMSELVDDRMSERSNEQENEWINDCHIQKQEGDVGTRAG